MVSNAHPWKYILQNRSNGINENRNAVGRFNTNSITSIGVSITMTSHGHHGVSNHRQLNCLFNPLSRHTEENIKTVRHWPLWGESTGDRWIPIKKTSNAENASIWWRNHTIIKIGWSHDCHVLVIVIHIPGNIFIAATKQL